MSTTKRVIAASSQQVWNVLADGWLYPTWVVGATRMRDVEEEWPAPGSRLHHSVGVWPLTIDDNTQVTDSQPGALLALRARGWPAGEANVTIRLRPAGNTTEVTITEDVARGPARLIPRPIRSVTLDKRNVETLRRLAFIAENRP